MSNETESQVSRWDEDQELEMFERMFELAALMAAELIDHIEVSVPKREIVDIQPNKYL